MLVSDGYAPRRTEHVSLHGPIAALVTELLQLPALDYGTVYHHISETRTYRTVGSGGQQRHFCSDSGPRRSVIHFNCAA